MTVMDAARRRSRPSHRASWSATCETPTTVAAPSRPRVRSTSSSTTPGWQAPAGTTCWPSTSRAPPPLHGRRTRAGGATRLHHHRRVDGLGGFGRRRRRLQRRQGRPRHADPLARRQARAAGGPRQRRLPGWVRTPMGEEDITLLQRRRRRDVPPGHPVRAASPGGGARRGRGGDLLSRLGRRFVRDRGGGHGGRRLDRAMCSWSTTRPTHDAARGTRDRRRPGNRPGALPPPRPGGSSRDDHGAKRAGTGGRRGRLRGGRPGPPRQLAHAISETENRLGPIDLLVVNHGIGSAHERLIWEQGRDVWEETMRVNLDGPYQAGSARCRRDGRPEVRQPGLHELDCRADRRASRQRLHHLQARPARFDARRRAGCRPLRRPRERRAAGLGARRAMAERSARAEADEAPSPRIRCGRSGPPATPRTGY